MTDKQQSQRFTGTDLAVALARLGWAGKCPFAPGTVASFFPGIPLAWLMAGLPQAAAAAAIAGLFFLACWAAGQAQRRLERHDPREVVIDELVGYLVTMIGFPANPTALLAGFCAFRLFDVWKPWPVRAFDRALGGGLGIVMDDVAAGCYAHATLWLLLACGL